MNYRRKIALVLVIMLLVGCIFAANITALAETNTKVSNSSEVLDDLQRDEDFDAAEWSHSNFDYTLEVITVAEGEDKCLYVYVYQPNKSVGPMATSINMRVPSNDNSEVVYNNYFLNLMSCNGVFAKYVVMDFKLPVMVDRTYEIVSIFRKFIEGVDEMPESGEINEIAFPVGGSWTFNDLTGLQYDEVEFVTVTSQYVGFVQYPTVSIDLGIILQHTENFQSHYIAFSTDKQIDDLLEVDVLYSAEEFDYRITIQTDQWNNTTTTYKYTQIADYPNQRVTLKKEDMINVDGIGQAKYGWSRIQTVEQFIDDVEKDYVVYSGAIAKQSLGSRLNDDMFAVLGDKQWVVRFYETTYKSISGNSFDAGVHTYSSELDATVVHSVSLMRLEFETEGKFYNLGVVSNKQTGSGVPDNTVEIDTIFDPSPLFVKMLSLVLTLFMVFLVVLVMWETFKFIRKK